jgi:hypothetical protein
MNSFSCEFLLLIASCLSSQKPTNKTRDTYELGLSSLEGQLQNLILVAPDFGCSLCRWKSNYTRVIHTVIRSSHCRAGRQLQLNNGVEQAYNKGVIFLLGCEWPRAARRSPRALYSLSTSYKLVFLLSSTDAVILHGDMGIIMCPEDAHMVAMSNKSDTKDELSSEPAAVCQKSRG